MPGSEIKSILPEIVLPISFVAIPLANINSTTDVIDLGTTHNFVTGDYIWCTYSAEGTSAAGITLNQFIYTIAVSSTTIKLATTKANALLGTAIDITSTGSLTGTFSFYKYLPSLSAYTFYPAYTKAAYSLNSSNPVEINFTLSAISAASYPGTLITSLPANHPLISIQVIAAGQYYQFTIARWTNYNDRMFPYYQTPSGNGGPVFIPNITTLGTLSNMNGKIVINAARQWEMWASNTSTLSNVYTSSALTANLPLELGIGFNFNNTSLVNCTIKNL